MPAVWRRYASDPNFPTTGSHVMPKRSLLHGVHAVGNASVAHILPSIALEQSRAIIAQAFDEGKRMIDLSCMFGECACAASGPRWSLCRQQIDLSRTCLRTGIARTHAHI